MSSRIQVHEDLVRAAFQPYDQGDTGFISDPGLHVLILLCPELLFESIAAAEVENLKQVLTESLDSPDQLCSEVRGLLGPSVFMGPSRSSALLDPVCICTVLPSE